MIYIGIDPGEHTGVAVWDAGRREFLAVSTVPLHRALGMVADVAAGNPVVVVVEDARQRRWIPRERSVAEYRGKLMGAGSIKRDCTVWEEFLQDLQKEKPAVRYELRAPQAGLTKWSPETFKRYTGWQKPTSNHARDAAMLVFGMK